MVVNIRRKTYIVPKAAVVKVAGQDEVTIVSSNPSVRPIKIKNCCEAMSGPLYKTCLLFKTVPEEQVIKGIKETSSTSHAMSFLNSQSTVSKIQDAMNIR